MFITDPGAIASPPKRIISLVPSLTELLSYLELQEETVGITKFCVHPEAWFRNKTRIGGTKNIHTDRVIALNPDLIICNKEENVKEQIEGLAALFPVYMSDVKTFEDALVEIKQIGMITGKKDAANALVDEINKNFKQLAFSGENIRTAYLIWKKPYMTIGADTFISDMLGKGGFENIYADQIRYPQLTTTELATRNPQLILLSTEPYPFKQKDIDELKREFPDAKILLADGEMFSWYGSRMQYAADYFELLRNNTGLR